MSGSLDTSWQAKSAKAEAGPGSLDWARACFHALFASAGMVAYLAPKGLVIVFLLLGLFATTNGLRDGSFRPSALIAVQPFLWCLPILALVSALWAIDPASATLQALRLAIELFVGVVIVLRVAALPRREQRSILVAIAAGFTLTVLFVLADLTLSGALSGWARKNAVTGIVLANHYSRGAVFHAIVLMPLCIGLYRSRCPVVTAITFATGAITILSLSTLSAQLALLIGALVVLGTMTWRRIANWLLIAIVGGTLILPIAFPLSLDNGVACALAEYKSSALVRVHIWNFVAEKIRERPILGWGMDASRSIPGGQGPILVRRCGDVLSQSEPVGAGQVMPLHPHNAVLQIWLELGAIGAAISAVTLLSLGTAIYRAASDRLGLAAAAAALAACVEGASVSYGIWQEWWVAALFLCAAITRIAVDGRSSTASGARMT
jgi:O-antigen ligase